MLCLCGPPHAQYLHFTGVPMPAYAPTCACCWLPCSQPCSQLFKAQPHPLPPPARKLTYWSQVLLLWRVLVSYSGSETAAPPVCLMPYKCCHFSLQNQIFFLSNSSFNLSAAIYSLTVCLEEEATVDYNCICKSVQCYELDPKHTRNDLFAFNHWIKSPLKFLGSIWYFPF